MRRKKAKKEKKEEEGEKVYISVIKGTEIFILFALIFALILHVNVNELFSGCKSFWNERKYTFKN